jgi:hypothetical protein
VWTRVAGSRVVAGAARREFVVQPRRPEKPAYSEFQFLERSPRSASQGWLDCQHASLRKLVLRILSRSLDSSLRICDSLQVGDATWLAAGSCQRFTVSSALL